MLPATAGSVLGASTGAEIADVFRGSEQSRGRDFSRFGHFAGDFFKVFFNPADAGEFDLTIRCDPENSWDVGQAVGVRDGICVRIVEQDGESYAKLLCESGCVFCVVLRDADEFYFAAAVGLVQTFKKWECVLAGGTGNFEEGEHYWAVG